MKPIYLEKLIAIILSIYSVSFGDIKSKIRNGKISRARAAFCYLARKYFNLSYPIIGSLINKDHSSVIYAVKNFDPFVLEGKMKKLSFSLSDYIASPAYLETQTRATKSRWSKLFQERGCKCQFCGFNDVVEIHHIVSLKAGGTNDLFNLLVLCPNHHSLLHHGLLIINPEKFPLIKIPIDLSTEAGDK